MEDVLFLNNTEYGLCNNHKHEENFLEKCLFHKATLDRQLCDILNG